MQVILQEGDRIIDGLLTSRDIVCWLHVQSGSVMSAERAAEEIVAAVMRPRPPREIVTGARACTALLAGFLQYWLWPGIVERKFSRMFGLDKLKPAALNT